MKKLLLYGCVIVGAATATQAQGAEPEKSIQALVGGTIITGNGGEPIDNGVILIKGERIACAGTPAECPIPEGADMRTLEGRTVIPGLVDAHVHYDGSGWFDTRPSGISLGVLDAETYAEATADLQANPQRFHRSWLCSGVTAVIDPGGPPWTLPLQEEAKHSTAAPHYIASGPLLTTTETLMPFPAAQGLNVHMSDEKTVRAAVRDLAKSGSAAVKIWGLEAAEDFEALRPLLRVVRAEAEQAGLPVVAHATTLKSAKAAMRDAGASVLVHSVVDRLVDGEFLSLARDGGVVYVPTISSKVIENVMIEGQSLGEDDVPFDCVDPQTRKKLLRTNDLPIDAGTREKWRVRAAPWFEMGRRNLKRVHEAGVRVATGTDAGNPLVVHGPAIHDELEEMVEAGLSPMEVLIASTSNGARAMGRTDFGTIERGKLADLVVLKGDPLNDISNTRNIELVVRSGTIWTRDQLEYPRSPGGGGQ